jgi:hypothetical protein
MAEYNAPASLITPWGTIDFNGDTPPAYLHDESACAGLDGAPTRAVVDPKPVTDGGIWHRNFKGPREVTLDGLLRIDIPDDAVTLEADLLAACESIFSDPSVTGTYEWTPSGSTLHSITVRCDILPTFNGPAHQKKYTFGLVAIDPAVTVA